MGDLIGYARVSTADQDPRMQLDALSAENCLKTYTDTATGTKADRPQWNACLADLRPGDTLVIWKIARLGRNLAETSSSRCRPRSAVECDAVVGWAAGYARAI